MSAPRRPRWPLLAAAGAAAVLIAYGLLWREGARVMRRSIEAFAATERAAGRDLVYARLSVEGFPFRLRGVLDDASAALAQGWRWSGDKLFIDAVPWAPDRLTLSAKDVQTFDLGELGTWRIDAKRARAVIARDSGHGWALRVTSGPARVAREGASAAFTTKRLKAMVAPDKNDRRLTLARIEITGFAAGGETRPVSAPLIDLAFEVADQVAASEGAPSREIRVRRLYAEADGGTMLLSGAFHVDGAGYPEGVLNAEIANPGAFASALGELGAIRGEDAETANASLSLAAIAGGGSVAAPLVLENGVASIAGVAVAKLPRVD